MLGPRRPVLVCRVAAWADSARAFVFRSRDEDVHSVASGPTLASSTKP